MKINKLNIEVTFTFSPAGYFLVNNKGEWSLNTRIDRSEKGKDDDVGLPVIFVSEQEAKELFENGFSRIEY